jgi:hypothetical protein
MSCCCLLDFALGETLHRLLDTIVGHDYWPYRYYEELIRENAHLTNGCDLVLLFEEGEFFVPALGRERSRTRLTPKLAMSREKLELLTDRDGTWLEANVVLSVER